LNNNYTSDQSEVSSWQVGETVVGEMFEHFQRK